MHSETYGSLEKVGGKKKLRKKVLKLFRGRKVFHLKFDSPIPPPVCPYTTLKPKLAPVHKWKT